MNIDELYTAPTHEVGAEMQVRDQSGKELELFITIAGLDSKIWRTSEIELKRMLMAGADPVEAKADAMGKCSLSWRGFQDKGKDLEFSREAVTSLYLNAPYIATQADKFLSKRGNFTKGKVE